MSSNNHEVVQGPTVATTAAALEMLDTSELGTSQPYLDQLEAVAERKLQQQHGQQQQQKGKESESDSEDHLVFINDPAANKARKHPNNYIRTTKYTILTFLPLNLFEQFMKVSNIYFFITMVIALIPGVSPTFPVTSILPVIFILGVACTRDAIEDIRRYLADRRSNGSMQTVVRDGVEIRIPSREIVVGDIVRVANQQEFPADLLLLSSPLPDGVAYVETANLDGETNLKVRKALPVTYYNNDVQRLSAMRGRIECELPCAKLHDFEGNLYVEGAKGVPLAIDQILLRGARLRNTPWVYGLCIYAGKNTRLFRNLNKKVGKFPALDRKLNKITAFMLVCQQLMCIVFTGLAVYFNQSTQTSSWYISFYGTTVDFVFVLQAYMAYFILFNLMIPMSLFVSLEILKAIQGKFMEFDNQMRYRKRHMIARTFNLNEELSEVDYVFTDKTGTLTENKMKYACCSVDNIVYPERTSLLSVFEDAQRNQTSDNNNNSSPQSQPEPENLSLLSTDAALTPSPSTHFSASHAMHLRQLREFLMCISLCHSVIVQRDPTTGKKLYEGQSTDEVALLHMARANGLKMIDKTQQGVYLGFQFPMILDMVRQPSATHENEDDSRRFYPILATLDFNSDRKRMSIVTKDPDTGEYIVYCKGADNVMLERTIFPAQQPNAAQQVSNHLEQFSNEGLRTLVLCRKVITAEFFNDWIERYRSAQTAANKKVATAAVAADLEHSLEYIGCTAIEDKLQDEVPETIDYLLKAGMKVWVLTGDKKETAINIALSSNLIHRNTTRLLDLKAPNKEECIEMLNEWHETLLENEKLPQDKRAEYAIIADGPHLDIALNECLNELTNVARYANSAICCRVTPKQKADVVRLVQGQLKQRGLAIGDGANDVPMIQNARVGIGIIGREGSQAERSSDYAIPRFKHLRRLLCVHGRYSALRNKQFLLMSFYKNMIVVFLQLLFAFFNGYTQTTVLDSWVVTLYNTIFTVLQPMAIGVLDRDIDDSVIAKHPESYHFQSGIAITWGGLFTFMFYALYHSIVMFFFALALFYNGMLNSQSLGDGFWQYSATISFTMLLVITLKFTIESRSLTVIHHIFNWGSLIVFIIFNAVYSSMLTFAGSGNMYLVTFEVLGDYKYWLYALLVVVACFLPDIVYKYCKREFRPEYWEILLQLSKQKPKTDIESDGTQLQTKPPITNNNNNNYDDDCESDDENAAFVDDDNDEAAAAAVLNNSASVDNIHLNIASANENAVENNGNSDGTHNDIRSTTVSFSNSTSNLGGNDPSTSSASVAAAAEQSGNNNNNNNNSELAPAPTDSVIQIGQQTENE